jgi:hypothetical protein
MFDFSKHLQAGHSCPVHLGFVFKIMLTYEFTCWKPSCSIVSFFSKRNSYYSQTEEGWVATPLSQQEKHTVPTIK